MHGKGELRRDCLPGHLEITMKMQRYLFLRMMIAHLRRNRTTTNLVRDTVGPNHGDPNPNTAEEMQHLHDTASLDNRNVDPKMSNAGNDQVRIENQSRTQKTFCIKQTLKESLW